jgi:Rnl2 family RNA ligase
MEIDEEPKLNGKGLVFKEYSSLELATRDKFIKGIRDAGYDAKDIEWVASEKIHGSNFSIHFNGESVRYGRRTDFLTKDIPVPCEHPGDYFLESFYDARKLVEQFHNKLNHVYNSIIEYDPKMIKFSIYGEYFGGNWPLEHPNAIKGGPKQVQKGVCYTPEH